MRSNNHHLAIGRELDLLNPTILLPFRIGYLRFKRRLEQHLQLPTNHRKQIHLRLVIRRNDQLPILRPIHRPYPPIPRQIPRNLPLFLNAPDPDSPVVASRDEQVVGFGGG